MSRKALPRALPDLGKLHSEFRGFSRQQTAVHELLKMLRATVELIRTDDPQHFYAQHDLARFFRVPQSTVHLACRQLAAEGLLSIRRGSGTLVLGHRAQPRVKPRGVVGVPLWTQGFAQLPYWRSFFISLEEALRRENLVSDVVFYQGGQEVAMEFAELLLAHSLDYCLWLLPPPASFPVINRLVDGGVRMLAITESHRLPACVLQYHILWKNAYVRALRLWRADGVRSVFVVGGTPPASQPLHPLSQALAQVRMDYQFVPDSLPVAKQANRDDVGMIFPDDFHNLMFCRRNPTLMLDLLGRARVLVKSSLLIQEIPSHLRLDIVHVEWSKVARRIANDISASLPATGDRPRIIQPTYSHHVPARQFGERF